MRLKQQTSKSIKEHIIELHRGLKNSKNKELLRNFIDYWVNEYIIEKNKENIRLLNK